MDQSAGMLSEDVKEKGYALLCVSYPRSDCTIQTIEEARPVAHEVALRRASQPRTYAGLAQRLCHTTSAAHEQALDLTELSSVEGTLAQQVCICCALATVHPA